jgi:Flp pilus assembly protein TadG
VTAGFRRIGGDAAMARLVRDRRGQAVVVEFVVMFFLLLGFVGGFLAYAMATHARSVTIQAADAGGRLLSIECDPQSPYYAQAASDAAALAVQTMRDGGLEVTTSPAAPGTAGSYTVAATCDPATGQAAVDITYEQRDVFPVLGHVLTAGLQADNAAGTFQIESGAVFPIE